MIRHQLLPLFKSCIHTSNNSKFHYNLNGLMTIDQYTEEELNQMCDKAELDDLTNRCLVAYWDNTQFNNSLIDAPERLYATWTVLLGWMEQVGTQRALEVLREASGKVDG